MNIASMVSIALICVVALLTTGYCISAKADRNGLGNDAFLIATVPVIMLGLLAIAILTATVWK